MNNQKKKLVFLLEDKSVSVKFFEREDSLLDFQHDVLQNEGVSFYYYFKDSANDVEESLLTSIQGGDGKKISEVIFKIVYGEKVLFSQSLHADNLFYNSFEKEEVKVFYFMEKIISNFENQLMEEHKKIILYKN